MTSTTPSRAGFKNGWKWLAFSWGLAEALFFFIVPDVLTSRLVLRNARQGFLACLFSLGGALLGGLLLYFIGRSEVPALSAMDYVPGISGELIEQARQGLDQNGLAALFSGALSGIPYKLYAVQAAPAAGASLGLFLAFSFAARLARFLLVTGLAWGTGWLLQNFSLRSKLRVHSIAWGIFYALYFWKMGF